MKVRPGQSSMRPMIPYLMQSAKSGGSGAAVAVELTPMIASLQRRGDFEEFHVASFTKSHQYFIQQYILSTLFSLPCRRKRQDNLCIEIDNIKVYPSGSLVFFINYTHVMSVLFLNPVR